MRKNSGFTLIELFVTMALMAILAAFAVPNIMKWVPNYRLKSAVQDTFSNFQRAKLMAAKRNITCTIIFNQPIDDKTYDYVVFLDPNNNLEYDNDEDVIAKVNLKEKYKGSVDTENITFQDNVVAFRPNGLPRNKGNGLGMGTVSLKNTNGRITDIILSSAGSVRIKVVLLK
ncbi:pilus assembly FimT family protein [Desulfonema magnum]|uniref:Type II secretion system protein H n=1 Tax=Desulfonema magnum TaxID=45655 RepID=A0A975GT64_9BACT|nr:GspH/FimT family pseudopilin [Desulfonema magnum]QTA92790.1 Prepilin-type cleavage/methylation domain-containing protein [Desulfonema magnum]